MFTTSVRGGKAFPAEQKIRELKTRILKINAEKLKISPSKIIEVSTLNMNLTKRFKMVYLQKKLNVDRCQENVLKLHLTCIDLRRHKDSAADEMIMTSGVLWIGEKVYVPTERIKKKSVPGKFYKQSVQNVSYFNKEKTFIIRAIQSIGGIKYY